MPFAGKITQIEAEYNEISPLLYLSEIVGERTLAGSSGAPVVVGNFFVGWISNEFKIAERQLGAKRDKRAFGAAYARRLQEVLAWLGEEYPKEFSSRELGEEGSVWLERVRERVGEILSSSTPTREALALTISQPEEKLSLAIVGSLEQPGLRVDDFMTYALRAHSALRKRQDEEAAAAIRQIVREVLPWLYHEVSFHEEEVRGGGSGGEGSHWPASTDTISELLMARVDRRALMLLTCKPGEIFMGGRNQLERPSCAGLDKKEEFLKGFEEQLLGQFHGVDPVFDADSIEEKRDSINRHLNRKAKGNPDALVFPQRHYLIFPPCKTEEDRRFRQDLVDELRKRFPPIVFLLIEHDHEKLEEERAWLEHYFTLLEPVTEASPIS
jgi:hypothetical protein